MEGSFEYVVGGNKFFEWPKINEEEGEFISKKKEAKEKKKKAEDDFLDVWPASSRISTEHMPDFWGWIKYMKSKGILGSQTKERRNYLASGNSILPAK